MVLGSCVNTPFWPQYVPLFAYACAARHVWTGPYRMSVFNIANTTEQSQRSSAQIGHTGNQKRTSMKCCICRLKEEIQDGKDNPHCQNENYKRLARFSTFYFVHVTLKQFTYPRKGQKIDSCIARVLLSRTARLTPMAGAERNTTISSDFSYEGCKHFNTGLYSTGWWTDLLC